MPRQADVRLGSVTRGKFLSEKKLSHADKWHYAQKSMRHNLPFLRMVFFRLILFACDRPMPGANLTPGIDGD
jgi:hypothetical protein